MTVYRRDILRATGAHLAAALSPTDPTLTPTGHLANATGTDRYVVTISDEDIAVVGCDSDISWTILERGVNHTTITSHYVPEPILHRLDPSLLDTLVAAYLSGTLTAVGRDLNFTGDVAVSQAGSQVQITVGPNGGEQVAADFSATGLGNATAGARFVGGTSTGHPTTDTFRAGDYAVALDGVLWVCTAGGTPGTWTTISGAGGGLANPMSAVGDLIVGTTAGAPARLAVGSTGYVLTVVGGVPTWAALTGGSPSGTAGGDLAGTYPTPTVASVNGASVPGIGGNANKLLKLDAGGGSFEFVPFGILTDTVCQGNDSRLANARTPTVHQSTHRAGGTDALPWDSLIHASGTHAARPSAASVNVGYLYFETDTDGGTLFRSNGTIWEQWAPGLSAGSGPPTGSAGGDLGGTYPNPEVTGLLNDALPATTGNGYLKRTSGDTAWEFSAFGSAANTVCQGNDSRLSNARTPTGHHATHELGGSDMLEVETFVIAGTHAARPAASNSGLTDNEGFLYWETDTQILFRSNGTTWEQVALGVGGSAPPSGAASGDLGGSFPDPEVIALQGDALPATGANHILKRNSGDTAWEGVGFGTAANTVCQGNDSRLSNNRTPTAHASTHLPAQSDPIDWSGTIHAAGTHASRPTAATSNSGTLYFETDTLGLFRSDGAAWTQIAAAASVGGSVTSVDLAMPSDFTVSGDPITGAGTLTVTANNQSANTVKAGPASGGAAAPTYRALVPADVPTMVASGGSHAAGLVPDPGSGAGSSKFLREDATFAVPPGTGYATVQDEGIALTQRATLNVVGRGLVADDSGGVTRLRGFDPATMTYECDEFLWASNATGAIGKLGWSSSLASGASLTGQAAEAGRPGLHRINGSTTNTGIACVNLGSATANLLPADTFDLLWIVRPTDMDANQTLRFGLTDGVASNPPVNGLYLEGLSTDWNAGTAKMEWFGVCRSGASQTRTDTSQATAANSFLKVRIRRKDASTIAFSVNDTAEVTCTSNVPTAALTPFAYVVATASSAQRHLDLDWFDVLVTGLSR